MKVLLLDDHPLILDALTLVLHALEPSLEVVATSHPDEALAELASGGVPAGGVQLILLDLNLGEGINGFDVLADLRQRHPHVPVVVVSGTDRLADVVRVVDLGGMGFVPKRSSRAELNRALGMVISGGVYLPQALLELITRWQGRELGDTTIGAAAAQLAAADAAAAAGLPMPAGLLPALATPGPGMPPAAAKGAKPAVPILTPRQNDVLALLLKGLPNKLIARELNLSVETVKDHVAAVLRALGVNSRTQAILAVGQLNQQGLGPLPGRPPGAA